MKKFKKSIKLNVKMKTFYEIKLNICLISLLIVLLIFPSYILSSQEKEQEKLKYEVKVILKLVEVYVVNKKGEPVKDLKESDFEIYIDGKLKTVAYFERKSLKKEETIQPEDEVKSLKPEERRKIFLLFDFGFNTPQGIKRAKEAALHFINTQVRPEDLVGILTYSFMSGFKMIEYLTDDHQKIKKEIEKIGIQKFLGRAEKLRNEYSGSMDQLAPKGLSSQEEPDEIIENLERFDKEFNIQIYKRNVTNFTLVFKELAKALKYIPGVKHIVLFSSGINNRIFYGDKFSSAERMEEFIWDFVRRSDDESMAGNTDLVNEYELMAKELAASGSIVYAVNTEGLSAGEESLRSSNPGSVNYSLMQLSNTTGGKYFGGTYDLKSVVKKISEMTDYYYVLGYYVKEEVADGKFHSIKVKVKRKGTEILTLKGYFNPKPFSQLTKFEKDLHLIDLALNDESIITGEVLKLSSDAVLFSDEGKENALIFTEIPMNKFIEGEGKVEIITLSLEKEGDLTLLQNLKIDVSYYRGQNLFFYNILPVKKGENLFRIVIRNLSTGKSGKASISFKASDEGGNRRLSQPLLLIKNTNQNFLAGFTSDRYKHTKNYPFHEEPYPFNQSEFIPLIGVYIPGSSNLFAVIRFEKEENEIKPEFNILTFLVNLSTGESKSISCKILNQIEQQTKIIYLVEFDPVELKPGNYSLYIILEDKLNKKRFNNFKIFSIQ
ncbi:MAG: VWA domain-containing protein [Acidobacteriota bacterium]